MHPPLFIRPLTAAEREQLRAGLRSADAFTLRRCQLLLASDRGQPVARFAADLGCSRGTVRNAIAAFHAEGLACLYEKSSRPHSARPWLGPERADDLKALLHQSPRRFGQPTSLWSLDRLAAVCFAQRWTPRQLSGEAVRLALKRLGLSWRRAKHWITSPDPAYARKKTRATGCCA